MCGPLSPRSRVQTVHPIRSNIRYTQRDTPVYVLVGGLRAAATGGDDKGKTSEESEAANRIAPKVSRIQLLTRIRGKINRSPTAGARKTRGAEHWSTTCPQDPPLTPNSILTLPRRAENHSGPAADHVPVLVQTVFPWKLAGNSGATHGSASRCITRDQNIDPARFPRPFFSGGGKIGDDRDASETVDNLHQPKPSPFHSNTIHQSPHSLLLMASLRSRYLPATFQRIP
jgi:hypothetical protein